MYSSFARNIRQRIYKKMVKDARTNEEITAIVYDDVHLSQLADAGFCFVPPSARSSEACGCKHGAIHYRTKKE